MSHHPLNGVREKLKRADKHLDFLKTKFLAYIESTPYSLVIERDVGTGHPRILFHVTGQPSLSLSTVVGDIVHNLRSGLDYIAHELIRVNGCSTTFQTQFPICESATDFFNEAICKNRLGGISLRGYTLIEAMQPYWDTSGNDTPHPLWLLHKLSNIDKHKMPNLTVLGATATINFVALDGHIRRTDHVERAVYDGAILTTVPARFLDEGVKMNGRVALHVAFQDAPLTGVRAIDGLQESLEFIGQKILPAVEPFFEPSS